MACFSRFHFHRIFSAMMGEPPAEFVRRLRLERAAGMLLNNPLRTVTDVALACGFSSSALFARLFRERFGLSPSRFRSDFEEKSKKQQAKSKKEKAPGLPSDYNLGMTSEKRRSQMPSRMGRIKVEVKKVPAMRLAYVKHLKGYQDGPGIALAFQKLFLWAGPRGLMGPEMKVLGMSLDNPDITPAEKCRYYACLTVTDDARPEGEVGIMDTHPGTYAVARFKGGGDIFKKAYDFLYGEWLPASGYQPEDHPCFEVYLGEPQSGAKPVFEFDLYVPVRPL